MKELMKWTKKWKWKQKNPQRAVFFLIFNICQTKFMQITSFYLWSINCLNIWSEAIRYQFKHPVAQKSFLSIKSFVRCIFSAIFNGSPHCKPEKGDNWRNNDKYSRLKCREQYKVTNLENIKSTPIGKKPIEWYKNRNKWQKCVRMKVLRNRRRERERSKWNKVIETWTKRKRTYAFMCMTWREYISHTNQSVPLFRLWEYQKQSNGKK